jgi:hypothetical protein
MVMQMRYAIVEGGTVANVAVADAPLAHNWIASSVAQIGWRFDGTSFDPPERQAAIPDVVSMRQARLALLAAGLLDSVEAAIAAAPPAARIEWEYAADVRRDYGLVLMLAAALGLTEQQLDDLFVTAASL